MAEIAEATKESMKEKKESMEAEGIRRDPKGWPPQGIGMGNAMQCEKSVDFFLFLSFDFNYF